MAKKYKGILKQERELFKKTYEMVHKPNQTNKENIQSTIDYFGHTLGIYINTDKQKNASSAAVGIYVDKGSAVWNLLAHISE